MTDLLASLGVRLVRDSKSKNQLPNGKASAFSRAGDSQTTLLTTFKAGGQEIKFSDPKDVP